MTLHKEISFEDEICAHLAAHGWIHEPGVAVQYDCQRALLTSSVGLVLMSLFVSAHLITARSAAK